MDRTATPSGRKAASRAAWALGDYHRFANTTIWDRGTELVEACRVRADQRVLDVAAGTGNTAIRAAEVAARVVASDLTPENFEAGRREARARGVDLEWVEADAEALPFTDAVFDVVTSSFGAIFAPDHLGKRVELLELARRDYAEGAATPRRYVELFKQTFGPVVATYQALVDQPDRIAALDRDFLDFATRANRGPPDGPAEYRFEYLLVVARKRTRPPTRGLDESRLEQGRHDHHHAGR